MKIPFCLPLIDNDVNQEVYSCLNETGWLTTGPKVKLLENEISTLCSTDFTICVNSWTSGMMLLIKWLELDPDDEVIIPAYTYAASALAVINSNVKCVMVDINDDFTIDLKKVEEAITSKTKAIMPVDVGGYPSNYKALKSLLKTKQVVEKFKPKTEFQKSIGRPIIISDAAHSIGSTIDGEPTPTYTDFSVLSFHSVKNITTGEGGAITFKEFEFLDKKTSTILEELRLLSLNGQNKSAFEKNKSGGWRYDIVTNGIKVNMPDINASIGLAQIRKYKNILLPERKKLFLTYNNILSEYSWAILPASSDGNRESSYHLYQLRIKNFDEDRRNELISQMESRGIGVNVHYIPLPMLSYFKNQGFDMTTYPISFKLYENEISLPIYNGLSLESIKFICDNLIDIIENIMKDGCR